MKLFRYNLAHGTVDAIGGVLKTVLPRQTKFSIPALILLPKPTILLSY